MSEVMLKPNGWVTVHAGPLDGKFPFSGEAQNAMRKAFSESYGRHGLSESLFAAVTALLRQTLVEQPTDTRAMQGDGAALRAVGGAHPLDEVIERLENGIGLNHTEAFVLGCKHSIEIARRVRQEHLNMIARAGIDSETAPNWAGECEVCGQSPIVPLTGMCGPCTWGEAETAGGNW